MVRRNPARFAVILFSVFLTTARTEATSITGTIGFAGATSPRAWLVTDNIDIFNNVATVLCSPVLIPCSGTFAGYEGGLATYNDFSLDVPGEPMSPLWTFNGFSFYLTEIHAQFTVRSDYGIVLSGSGDLFGPSGFESTRALWSFSANSFGGLPRFSSTTTPVPDDGGTLGLLTSALLVIAVIGWRKLPRVA